MGLFESMKISASALSAQRLRMDVIANNIANQQTTRTAEGGAYRREQVVFRPQTQGRNPAFAAFMHRESPAVEGEGVAVVAVVQDASPGVVTFEPNNPDANADGYVQYPNVDVATEMTDMLSATRSYEANTTVFNAIKGMTLKALEIGR